MIHLDTSFLIRALVPRSSHDRKLRKWLSEGVSVGIGAIGWAEFLCGPVEPSQAALAARFLGEPVSFTAEDAELSARARHRQGTAGSRFGTGTIRASPRGVLLRSGLEETLRRSCRCPEACPSSG